MQTHYARTDLAELGRLVASYFESLASERGIVYVVSAPDPLPAEVDPDKVQRELLNLLSNAFKFSPDRGTIRYSINATRGDARVVVEDSGPGIPEHKANICSCEPLHFSHNRLSIA